MNALLLLMGLLLLSYIGSFLVGGRAIRGFGLPSGSEYLVLGFVIGPTVLGLVERSMLDAFEPIADVALGWLAWCSVSTTRSSGGGGCKLSSFVAGEPHCAAHRGRRGGRRILPLEALHPRSAASSSSSSRGASGPPARETTRHAVRWVVERHQRAQGVCPICSARSPTATISSRSSPRLYSLPSFPLDHVRIALPALGWAGITVGLGVLFGAIAASLLGREFRLHESWGVLFGTSLFAIGLAARLGLSFIWRSCSSWASRSRHSRDHREEVVAMVAPTERPVLAPRAAPRGRAYQPRGIAGPRLHRRGRAGGAHRWPSSSPAAFCARLFRLPRDARELRSGSGSCRPARWPWPSGFRSRYVSRARSAIPFWSTVAVSHRVWRVRRARTRLRAVARAQRRNHRGQGSARYRGVRGRVIRGRRKLTGRGEPMSHGDARPRAAGTRVIQAGVLALLFGLLFLTTRAVPEIHEGVGTIAAVGFLLLVGTLMSELVETHRGPAPHRLPLGRHHRRPSRAATSSITTAWSTSPGQRARARAHRARRRCRAQARHREARHEEPDVGTLLQSSLVIVGVVGVFLLLAPDDSVSRYRWASPRS